MLGWGTLFRTKNKSGFQFSVKHQQHKEQITTQLQQEATIFTDKYSCLKNTGKNPKIETQFHSSPTPTFLSISLSSLNKYGYQALQMEMIWQRGNAKSWF